MEISVDELVAMLDAYSAGRESYPEDELDPADDSTDGAVIFPGGLIHMSNGLKVGMLTDGFMGYFVKERPEMYVFDMPWTDVAPPYGELPVPAFKGARDKDSCCSLLFDGPAVNVGSFTFEPRADTVEIFWARIFSGSCGCPEIWFDIKFPPGTVIAYGNELTVADAIVKWG